MTSWIYVFSKFTPEALLFEALFICLLCAGYAAFWVLRKRRHGVIESDVPGNVVREYLAQLTYDAEMLRTQLFGILNAQGVQIPRQIRTVQVVAAPADTQAMADNHSSPVDPQAAASSSEQAAQVAALEARMQEQAQAMEAILGQKQQLENELAQAKAAQPAVAEGGSSAELDELKKKIALLESKLAEYSVIEDDLANLKRLQQENLQLKAALAAKGGDPQTAVAQQPTAPESQPEAAAAPEAPTPATPEAAAPAPEPVPESAPEPTPEAPEPASAAPAPAPAMEAAAGDTSPDALAQFENLINQNEGTPEPPKKKEKPAPAGATTAPAFVAPAAQKAAQPAAPTPAAAKQSSTSTPAADTVVKSDADLLAEFEKMLNS